MQLLYGSILTFLLAGSIPMQSQVVVDSFRFQVDTISTIVVDTLPPDTTFRVTFLGDTAVSSPYTGLAMSVPDSLAVGDTLLPVTGLADSAFWNCSALDTLYLPATLDSIAAKAFAAGCDSLLAFRIEAGNRLYASTDSGYLTNAAGDTLLLCPKGRGGTFSPAGTGIQVIAAGAFIGIPLDTLDLNGLTAIGDSAFAGCDSLRHLYIPENLPQIGAKAFYGCDSLKTLSLPFNLAMGDSAFWNCSGLDTVKMYGENSDFIGLRDGIFKPIIPLLLISQKYLPDIARLGCDINDVWRYTFKDIQAITSLTTTPSDTAGIHVDCLSNCRTIYVETDNTASWRAWSLNDWLRPSTNPSGNISGSFRLNIVPNPEESPRQGYILIAAGEGKDSTSVLIPVEQDARILPDSIRMAFSSLMLQVGDSIQLSAQVLPSNATDTTLYWSNADTLLARISSTGFVHALSAGTDSLIVHANGGACQAVCMLTVIPPLSVDLQPMDEADSLGEGNLTPSDSLPSDTFALDAPFSRIRLALNLPAATGLTGFFTLQLPKGVHLNADSTCLSARLEQGYDLSYSKLDETGSTWLLRIDASPLREAEDSAAVDSFREIADIGLQMDDSLLGKDFLVSFDTINFTLSNGLRLAEGNKSIPIRVASLYGTPVATETVIKPALPVGIRFEGGELLLDTPFAEEVRLFDFNGRLLFQKGKKAGEAVFNLPTGLPRLMLLCGSSGWSRKLYRQGN